MEEEPLRLDLRHEEIPCDMRHLLVMTAWEQLPPGDYFEVTIDHNPAPLRRQLARAGGEAVEWDCQSGELGAFRIRIGRKLPD